MAVKKQVGNRFVQSDQIGKAAAPFKPDKAAAWCDYFV
jgi:hypothetical protein